MFAIVRRAAGIVVTTILVVVVVGLAVLFWLVQRDGWLVQSVATGSMQPTIPTGSVILSRPVPPDALEVGDVIVFASPTGATVAGGDDGAFATDGEMLITHRVVEIVQTEDGGPAFRTKGDGNAAEDPWTVAPAQVRARYVAHVPWLGTVVSRPDLRRWLYLAVAAAGCVVIVQEGRAMTAGLRQRRADGAVDDGSQRADARSAAQRSQSASTCTSSSATGPEPSSTTSAASSRSSSSA